MAEIRINATGALKLYDSDDSNYVALQSAGTVCSIITWTLPSADGSSGQVLSTNGSGTLSWATASAADPASADGDTLGTASAEWSDLYLADGGQILFGNDQEVTLTHSADSGLLLKHTATADDKPINLVLQTGETDMAANDVIGKISWQAPDEGTGTDAILVSAAIQAVAEGNHSSSSNATSLQFMTGASEAAATKMTLTSAGKLEVSGGADIEGAVVFNEDSADVDFRIESNSYTHMLTVDGGANVVGVSTGGFMGDLGAGIHIKTADSSAGAHANADELVIENSAHSGISLLSGTTSAGNIYFADSGDNDIGVLSYDHNTNTMNFGVNAATRMSIASDGKTIVKGVVASQSGGVHLIGADEDGTALTDTGDKEMKIGLPHKTNSEEPVALTFITSHGSNSEVRIGGGDDAMNAATIVSLFTGSNTTTTTGTKHFTMSNDGTLTATDTSIGSISDSRIKENISNFTYDLAKFKQFQPKTFDWKNPIQHNNASNNRGFIAQDIQAIDDYWVGEIAIDEGTPDYSLIPADEIGEHKSLTSKLDKKDTMYVSVINQLITKIETLEAKVAVLEG